MSCTPSKIDVIVNCAGLGPEDGGDVGDERVPVHVPAADQHAAPDYTKDVSRGKRGIGAFSRSQWRCFCVKYRLRKSKNIFVS